MKNEKKITVYYRGKLFFEIENDTPNLKNMVKKIIEIEGDFVESELTINSTSDEFDRKGFKEVIVKLISSFIEKKKLNTDNLKKALLEIEKKTNDLGS